MAVTVDNRRGCFISGAAGAGVGFTATGAGGGAGSELIPVRMGEVEVGREFGVVRSGAIRLFAFAEFPEGVFGAAIFEEIILGRRAGVAGMSSSTGSCFASLVFATAREVFSEIAPVFLAETGCAGGTV